MPVAKKSPEQVMLEAVQEAFRKSGVTPPEGKANVDMVVAAVRDSLEKFGKFVPPKDALFSVMRATCPHCEHEGPLMEDFGLKKNKYGNMEPQSWCRNCRNGKSAHPGRFGKNNNKKS